MIDDTKHMAAPPRTAYRKTPQHRRRPNTETTSGQPNDTPHLNNETRNNSSAVNFITPGRKRLGPISPGYSSDFRAKKKRKPFYAFKSPRGASSGPSPGFKPDLRAGDGAQHAIHHRISRAPAREGASRHEKNNNVFNHSPKAR